jgi:Domain of unknown function (DUF5122) beta-propeller
MKNDDLPQMRWGKIDIDTAAFLGLVFGILLHLLILFAALMAPVDARADVGDFRSWGIGGKTQFNVGSGAAEVRGIVQYPNSKMIVATGCNAQAQLDWCFTKLDFFGNVDTTWGTANSGSVIETTTAQDSLIGVAPASNGGWFGFGGCASSACIIKYLASGARDASFGTNGKKTLNGFAINALKLRADGRITYVSECYQGGVAVGCVGRLMSNGDFDANFNGGQDRTVAPGTINAGSIYSMSSIALDPVSERIWLTGLCRETNKNEFCVARLNANGTPDTSYAANGWARFTMQGVNDIALQILLRPDGTALLIGNCQMSASDGFPISICVTQLLPWTAVIDTSFGDNGRRFLSPIAGGQHQATGTSAFLQQDGALGIFGSCQSTIGLPLACMMLLSGNGTDDRRLSSAKVSLNMAASDTLMTTQVGVGPVVRDSAGALFVHAFGNCGTSNGSNPQPCLARVEWAYPRGGTCTLDLDGDGQVLASTDALMLARVTAGFRGTAVTNGALGAGALRGWARIQEMLARDCGMSVAP